MGATLVGGGAASAVLALAKPAVGAILGDPNCFAAEAAGGLANGLGGVLASFGVNWASQDGEPQPSAELELALRKALDGGLQRIEEEAPDPHGWVPLWRERFVDSPEATLAALTGEHHDELWARHNREAGDVADAFWPLVEQTLTILAWRPEKHNPLNLRVMHADLREYLRVELPEALREQWDEEVAKRQPATNKLVLQRTGKLVNQSDYMVSELAEIKRLLVRDLTTGHATEAIREKQLADEQTQRLLDELKAKDQELRRVIGDRDKALAERQEAQAKLQEVIAERAAIAGQVEITHPELAEQVRKFHEQIQELTATDDPELLAAYQRYADGDTRGALPVIGEIVAAKQQALQAAARVVAAAAAQAAAHEAAELQRPYAALVLEAKDRGEQTTAQAIEVWERLQELDPGYHWGWVELGRLYMDAGKLGEAQAAAQRALETAGTDRERSVVFNELGNAAVNAGSLQEAGEYFKESLKLAERLAAQNPSSAAALRDLSISFERLGDVAVQAGQLDEARRRFEQDLEISERLAAQNPSSAAALRDLTVSYIKLGDVAVQAGQLDEARRRFEQGLEISERLAAQNPSSAEALRDLIVSYAKLGGLTGDAAWWRKALRVAEGLDAEGRLAPVDAWMLPVLREKAGE